MGRRWLPWEPRLRKADETLDALDIPAPDGCAFDALDDLFVGIAVVIAVVLFVLFVVPILVVIVELVLLAALVLLGVLVRVLLRRPWIVDARRMGTSLRHSWKVVGWRASGHKIREVAGGIATGREPRAQV